MKSNGGGVGSDRISTHGLKKGPWTAAEDAILMEYVKKHGEGNWNAVQKNSGLMRCGKSCRLRWANHLRPNLKKGSFTPEEERIIIQLHAKLGNKWARMAAQLPGRTDNEIKNYWNTRMKRRQRAGLPIYPQKARDGLIVPEQQQEQGQEQQIRQYQGRKRPNCSSPISSNYNFGLSSSNSQGKNELSSNFSPLQYSSSAIPSFYSNQLYTSSSNNSDFALSFSPTSPFVSSSSNLYNQNITAQFPAPLFQFNSGCFEQNLSFSSFLMGAQTEPIDFASGLIAEQPSCQTSPQATSTPASSYASSGSVSAVVASGDTSNYCEASKGSSGLLDALLVESISLSRNKDGEEFPQDIDKGKGIMDAANVEEDSNKYINVEKQWDDISSSQPSMGEKPSEESIEEMNSMDEDLFSLLNNFPLSMPLPEWYTKTTRMSNGPSSGGGGAMTEGNMVLDAQQNDVSPAGNLDRALDSCYWKNMPGIC